MSFNKHKDLTVFLFLLILLGQSVMSVSAACPDLAGTSTSTAMTFMTSMDMESSHHAADTLAHTDNSHDCCNQNQDCPMDSCASAGIISTSPLPAALPVASKENDAVRLAAITAVPSSLYRPPISH